MKFSVMPDQVGHMVGDDPEGEQVPDGAGGDGLGLGFYSSTPHSLTII